MHIKQQKNVYYIDVKNKTYKGYIETIINTCETTLIKYKFGAFDITNVAVYQNDTLVYDAIFTIEYLKDKFENLAAFKSIHWNYLKIKLPDSYKNLEVKIYLEYTSLETNTSVLFYKQISMEDRHQELVCYNRNKNSAGIFPSIDENQSYSWELVYVFSSTEDLKIVSPGVLYNFLDEDNLNTFTYKIDRCYADLINFAIGTYDRYEIYNGDDTKVVYCPTFLESMKDVINELLEDFSNILKYVENFIQMAYPLESLNVLFTLLEIEKANSYNIAIYNIAFISSSNDIEPKFLMKRIISDIVSTQVFHFYIHCAYHTDHWIFCGLKGYLEDYCVRLLLGNNEFLYQYKVDKDYVIKNDVYELPLCHQDREESSFELDFYIKKCKLVFHTLESNLSKAFIEKIAHFLIKKRSEICENYTWEFYTLIKDITGKDMKSFFEYYIFRPGLVKVSLKFTVDTKKNRVDYKLHQEPTSKMANKNTVILGGLTLMSYEVEGSFEHVITNTSNYFYYHIRTKKRKKLDEEEEDITPLLWMRFDPKREYLIDGIIEQPDYMFIEQALDKNVIGQLEALDQLAKNPSVQICEVLERILENTHIFYKVRIKVMYILSKINIDKFVGFQRLIQFFTKKYFVQSSTIIKPNEFVFVNYFLQKHCARALSYTESFIVKSSDGRIVQSIDIICSFLINILKFNDNSANSYSDSWYIASVIENLCRPILASQHSVPKNTDQHSNTMEQITNEHASTKQKNIRGTEEFDFDEDSSDELKDILKEDTEDIKNDKLFLTTLNYGNTESGNEEKKQYLSEILEEVERYRIMDMVFPSHKNIVTEAILYLYGRLAINGRIGLNKMTLISLSKFPNSIKVRKAAFVTLVLLYNDNTDVYNYLLSAIETETIGIKYIILDAWLNLLEVKYQETKNSMLTRINNLNKLVRLFEYDTMIKTKIYAILDFLENEAVSMSVYYEKRINDSRLKQNANLFASKISLLASEKAVYLIKIRFKGFKDMIKQYYKESSKIKFTLNVTEDETCIKDLPKFNVPIADNNTEIIATEVKMDFEACKTSPKPMEDHIKDIQDQNNARREDHNLQEMLRFDELKNNIDLKISFDKKAGTQNPDFSIESYNDILSSNLSKSDNKKKLLAYENNYNDILMDKQAKSSIRKLFDDYRSQVTESSKNSESVSFSGSANFMNTELDETYDEYGRTKSLENNQNFTSSSTLRNNVYDNSSIKTQNTSQKIDLEKFLLDNDSDERSNILEYKTQVLEECDFGKQFEKIDMTFEKNIDQEPTSIFNNSLSSNSLHNVFTRNKSSINTTNADSQNFAYQPFFEQPLAVNYQQNLLNPQNTGNHSSNNSIFQIKNPINSISDYYTPDADIFDMNINKPTKVESFFDDEDYCSNVLEPVAKNIDAKVVRRISLLVFRFSILYTIRLPVVERYISDNQTTWNQRQDTYHSPSLTHTKKASYQVRHNDPIVKKLFFGTINGISTRQVNKVILKNKNNNFFDWKPKTFAEIENYVSNANKYKKVLTEIERSLVFSLSYSHFGSRTYNLAKKLFDRYESVVYETYPIPTTLHFMTDEIRGYCVDFLNKICLNSKYKSFIRPVDTEGLETYIDIVRSPICLNVIQKKMMNYITLEAFYGDLKQITKNCCFFNQSGSDIAQCAKKLCKKILEFDEYLKPLKVKCKSADFIKSLLKRFEHSSCYLNLIDSIDKESSLNFKDIINEVRNIQNKSSMLKFMLKHESYAEIRLFEEHIFYAYNVFNGKVFAWDI